MAKCSLCRLGINRKNLKYPSYPNLAFTFLNLCHHCQSLISPIRLGTSSAIINSDLPLCSRFIYGLEKTEINSLLLHDFKYQRNIIYGKILATALVQNIQTYYFDQPFPEAIIIIPPCKKRFLARGFSQTHIIADWLGRHFSLPQIELLHRTKATDQQAKLNPRERQENMKNAFSIIQSQTTSLSTLSRIVVIDDVVTTGATINAALQLIESEIGPSQIDVWSLIYTPRRNRH